MKIAEIKLGMKVKHISDYGVGHTPQKLIVIKIDPSAKDEPKWDDYPSVVQCEWFSRIGELHREWFNHNMLEKW